MKRRATHLTFKGRTWGCVTLWLDEFGVIRRRAGYGWTVRQAIKEWENDK